MINSVYKYSYLSLTVETKNFKTNARCSSWLDFMQVPEKIESSSASPIIQFSLRQDA